MFFFFIFLIFSRCKMVALLLVFVIFLLWWVQKRGPETCKALLCIFEKLLFSPSANLSSWKTQTTTKKKVSDRFFEGDHELCGMNNFFFQIGLVSLLLFVRMALFISYKGEGWGGDKERRLVYRNAKVLCHYTKKKKKERRKERMFPSTKFAGRASTLSHVINICFVWSPVLVFHRKSPTYPCRFSMDSLETKPSHHRNKRDTSFFYGEGGWAEKNYLNT